MNTLCGSNSSIESSAGDSLIESLRSWTATVARSSTLQIQKENHFSYKELQRGDWSHLKYRPKKIRNIHSFLDLNKAEHSFGYLSSVSTFTNFSSTSLAALITSASQQEHSTSEGSCRKTLNPFCHVPIKDWVTVSGKQSTTSVILLLQFI